MRRDRLFRAVSEVHRPLRAAVPGRRGAAENHGEEVYARIARAKGVLHWNGEQILEWYLEARERAK